jgi:murein DD-endopeptidase MepM/ murein hydrolase activator NlpD
LGLLDMRRQWREEAAALALAAPARPRFNLIVDLADEPLGWRWLRGAATLTLLVGLLALIAPNPLEPILAQSPDKVGAAEAEEYAALGIGALADGSRIAPRMAANALAQPIAEAPDRPAIDLFASLAAGDDLGRLLLRSGATPSDAGTAARLVRSAAAHVAPGTSIAIRLGRRTGDGTRPIERVALRAGLDQDLAVVATAAGLALRVTRIAVDATPLRIRGRVGDGLYWSLRASGVSPQAASEYLRALSPHLDVGGEIGPDDRFDLILASRRAVTGERQEGPLLYAAVHRFAGGDVRLMKWKVGGAYQWMNTDIAGPNGAGSRSVAAMAWPVAARITSGFGYRVHPILRFGRMHNGIDFGAAYGQPIVAAADGQVTRAGWAGGYGRQVRLAHDGGMGSSYSHMSRIIVDPGTLVRQGQLIGYVGSTGLSTGPHLHYEVYRNGVAVNPMGVRFASRAVVDGEELARFRARLAALMKVGTKG